MQPQWADRRDERPPPERAQPQHGQNISDEDSGPRSRRSDQGYGSYTSACRFERDPRDHDRPAEPKRSQEDYHGFTGPGNPNSHAVQGPDGFQIRGYAGRERSTSPPRRGYIDYDAPESQIRHGGIQPRYRDARYDTRQHSRFDPRYEPRYDSRYKDRRGRERVDRSAPGESDNFRHREAYDPTVIQPQQEQALEVRNRGDDDAGSATEPVRYLLVKGLKIGLSESVFAKGVAKLERGPKDSTGALPGSLRSVMLVYDHESSNSKSRGWGFAWFKDTPSALAAFSRARDLGHAFTISSQVAEVRMAHNAVFPRIDAIRWQPDERFTFVLPGGTGGIHTYKDPRYYVSNFTVNESELPQNTTHSTDDEQLEVSLGGSKKKTKKRAHDGDDWSSGQKRVQMNPAMSALANRWSAQHKEIHEEDSNRPKKPEVPKQAATGVNTIAPAPVQKVQTFTHSTAEMQSCFLCQAVWQSSDASKLDLHREKSQKHAEKLKDESQIQAAYERMKSKGINLEDCILLDAPAEPSPAPEAEAASTYVDRAALRREVQARVQPALEKPKGFSLKNLKADSQASAPPPSKGLGMMQRLGYKAGQGLGAEGSTGVTAPIDQKLYAAGVGLGHEKGKVGNAVEEAEKATRGGELGYLEKAQESARERFEKLSK